MCVGLAILLAVTSSVMAQIPPARPASPSVSHRAWTKQMGAPSFVQSITQDRHGFLWVGSADGLFRFDGVTFEPIPPAKNHKRTALAVSALATAPNGDIWIGYAGSGGVAVYRGNKVSDARLPDPGSEITQIVIDSRGNPWVLNSGGGTENVLKFEGGRWIPVHRPDGQSFEDVIDLALAQDGSMWAYDQGRIYLARPGQDRFVATPITGTVMGDFARDRQGRMILSDRDGSRRILTDAAGMPTRGAFLTKLPPFSVLRTRIDRDGMLWGTTFMDGVFYGPTGGPLQTFSEAQGITAPRASAIYLDRSGNVWTGSEGGLDRFSKPIVETSPLMPTNPQMGYSLTIDPSGRALVTTGDTIWDMTDPDAPKPFSKLPDAPYGVCVGDSRRIWAVMATELLEIRDGKVVGRFPWPVEPMDAPTCAVRRDGSVWAAIPNTGIFRAKDGKWERIRVPANMEQISDLTFDQHDRLILIVERKNVAILDGDRVSFWEGRKTGLERPTSINFLGEDVVIGGLTGMLRLKGGKATRLDFEAYPWLRDIRAMVTAPDGYVWLLGYRGISRVREADLKAGFDKPGLPIPYQIFDDDNSAVGIPQRATGLQAGIDRNGMIWFLTRQKVFRVQPHRAIAVEKPVVVIKAMTLDGRRYTQIDDLHLPGGARNISFDFSVADLSTPTHRRFRYRIDGYDTGWTEIGGRRQINLTSLGPGSYHLNVETDDERGQWVSPGAGLDFTVAPLVHQTWWFRAILLLLVLGLGWLVIRWRIRAAARDARREAENRLSERTRIARDLHDTFLQGFQGSALRLQAVADRLPEESRERKGLETVLRGVDGILEEGRRRVQSLRREDRPVELDEAIEALAGDLLADGKIAWRLEASGKARSIAADAADEMLLIVREALANVIRHSQATQVTMDIRYAKVQVEIDITDNGVGIPTDADDLPPAGHFGLVGMKERAMLIDASLRIASASPGTRVSLSVPARRAYSTA